MYKILADAVVLAHFLFIIFVVLGGLLVIRRPKVAFIHLPAAIWGAVVEIFGWICPLTPLENHLRQLADTGSYGGDFIARYLVLVIYPENLTATVQQLLGGLVIAVNIIFYTIAIKRQRARPLR
ncbi:MAG TPA: DUF2784 domain-containing protein [Smithellaceae bacterium]|nr:DUF2784 domain-containing protein [Smithellaceae bacterium]